MFLFSEDGGREVKIHSYHRRLKFVIIVARNEDLIY